MSKIEQIKNKLESLNSLINEDAYVHELNSLDTLVSDISDKIAKNYFIDKLNSIEWPAATDQAFICNSDSDEDKIARASAIYSLFIVDRMKDPASNNKVLDFGCGEGHVINCAVDSGAGFCVGYDIEDKNWSRWQFDNHFLTTDFGKVKDNGPYDLILMFDVLDHILNRPHIDVLKDVKGVLANNGKIVVRCHPWCCRHGTHLWKLNKAFAHMVFTEDELAAIGYIGLPTFKITIPRETYDNWFYAAGLRITYYNMIWDQQSGPIFENNPLLKAKVLKHYDNKENINYSYIEPNFLDYVLENQ